MAPRDELMHSILDKQQFQYKYFDKKYFVMRQSNIRQGYLIY